ncbi:MAG: signal peptidase I [Firmicutes bacterium]|nr:signal peptidase I [Bacillota bacterium]
MKKFIRLILYLLTSLVVLLFIITLVFAYNKQYSKLTYFCGFTGFINTGTSMLPDINPGDLIIVYKQKEYYKNDVISYASDENYITTHRIIEKLTDSYVTKGDNNTFIDGNEVSSGQIYGKLVLIIPGVNNILNFFWEYKYYLIVFFILIPGIIALIKRGTHVR